MSNTFGTHFKLTTFGESHGSAIGGVIDGCPAGLRIDNEHIAYELARRRGEGLSGVTSRCEPDNVEWLSGLLDGVTLGSPIAFMVRNCDARSGDYKTLSTLYRPGHGDYTWKQKYGICDVRGGGRCAARETVARVVAGAIAKHLLSKQNITIETNFQPSIPVVEGDTVGGIVSCCVKGVPAGVGEPLFSKLQSQLAAATMSIPSAISFELGEGIHATQMHGSEYIDRWNNNFTTRTNHCGGIQGGLSNGMPICFRVAFHPIITIPRGIPCIDANGKEHFVVPKGRHDTNHVGRAAVIVEAMAALVFIDNLLSPQSKL